MKKSVIALAIVATSSSAFANDVGMFIGQKDLKVGAAKARQVVVGVDSTIAGSNHVVGLTLGLPSDASYNKPYYSEFGGIEGGNDYSIEGYNQSVLSVGYSVGSYYGYNINTGFGTFTPRLGFSVTDVSYATRAGSSAYYQGDVIAGNTSEMWERGNGNILALEAGVDYKIDAFRIGVSYVAYDDLSVNGYNLGYDGVEANYKRDANIDHSLMITFGLNF